MLLIVLMLLLFFGGMFLVCRPYGRDFSVYSARVALEEFALCYGRMPTSLEEMVAMGYLSRTQPGQDKKFHVYRSKESRKPPYIAGRVFAGRIINLRDLHIQWGATPDDLMLAGDHVLHKESQQEVILLSERITLSKDRARKITRQLLAAMQEGQKRGITN